MTQTRKRNLAIATVIGAFFFYVALYIDLRPKTPPTPAVNIKGIERQISVPALKSRAVFHLNNRLKAVDRKDSRLGSKIEYSREEGLESEELTVALFSKKSPEGELYNLEKTVAQLLEVSEARSREFQGTHVSKVLRNRPNDVIYQGKIMWVDPTLDTKVAFGYLFRIIVGERSVLSIVEAVIPVENSEHELRLLEKAELIES